MSRFVPTTQSTTIQAPHWDPSESVTIRTSLNGYELGYIDAARRDAVLDSAGATAIGVRSTPHEHMLAVLECGVVSWTFREGRKAIPATRENFKRLSLDDQQYIATAILTGAGVIPKMGEAQSDEDDDATFQPDTAADAGHDASGAGESVTAS